MDHSTSLSGLLLLDKPEGMTSMTAVSRVKRALGLRKAGHTGTLDPIATGVLPICIGQTTKVAEFLLATDKTYCATLQLGISTDTYDIQGRILEERPWPTELQPQDFVSILASFTGEIEQIPPVYSALKIQGQRAYTLARNGVPVDMNPRQVTIFRLELVSWELPYITIVCEVSKGTYIRSLIRDLGDTLGCGACMTALRRLNVGAFGLEQSVNLSHIEQNPETAKSQIWPTTKLLAHWPQISVSPAQERLFCNGAIPHDFQPAPMQPTPHCVLSPTGQLLALIVWQQGTWSLLRVFSDGLP